MNRVLGLLVASVVFLWFAPTPGFAAKWVLVESDGQLHCARGFRPGGRLSGPSTIGVFASRDACEAKRLGKPLPKAVAAVKKKPKAVVVAAKSLKPAVVPKKKKKKKIVPPPPQEEEESAVH